MYSVPRERVFKISNKVFNMFLLHRRFSSPSRRASSTVSSTPSLTPKTAPLEATSTSPSHSLTRQTSKMTSDTTIRMTCTGTSQSAGLFRATLHCDFLYLVFEKVFCYCRYVDYRTPPWDSDPYAYTATFWHVLAAQFMFVVAFEVRRKL